MEEKKPQFNPMAFAMIYFLMFCFAFAINGEKNIIRYPKTDAMFWNAMLTDGLIAIVIGFVVVAISQVISKRIPALRNLEGEFFALLGPLKKEEIFYIAFFSALGEEFLFRGIIQEYAGLFFTSIFFGLLHSAPGKKGQAWSMFALVMGFVLGGLYICPDSKYLVPRQEENNRAAKMNKFTGANLLK